MAERAFSRVYAERLILCTLVISTRDYPKLSAKRNRKGKARGLCAWEFEPLRRKLPCVNPGELLMMIGMDGPRAAHTHEILVPLIAAKLSVPTRVLLP